MLAHDQLRLPLVVSAFLYLSFSLLCTQLPLTNYLGYEFSALTALLTSFVAGFTTINSVRRFLREKRAEEDHAGEALGAFRRAVQLNLLFLIIPFSVMLANALFVKNCSLGEGVGFFLLLPVVTALFASALGVFCTAHYRRPKTVFTLFVAATFIEVLTIGYFTPAIFSYNFFYGYFPGLTYDEALGIQPPLILFRVFTLMLAAALVWMAWLLLRSTHSDVPTWEKGLTLVGEMLQGRRVFITTAIATLIIVVWWFRGELGFDASSRFIQHQLGKAYTTPHFRIYYAASSYSDDEIRWVAAEHEFRLKQITDALRMPFRGTIESYIYPSAEVKQRLMGAGNTNIAKPWSGQIHLTQQTLDATLKHELVHVLAAPFGLPIIKASLSTGLVEGLAMAIEWDWGNRTLHQYAAAMRRFGVAPEIAALMSFTGFAAHASSVSYVLAGSFCRYLMDTYGMRPVMQVYRSNDYERAFGKSLHALIDEWHAFLDKIPVGGDDRDAVDVLFRRPPIFEKVCARVVAMRNKEAAKAFGRRDYRAAAALYKQSFEDGRGYDALSGYVVSAVRLGEYASVIALFDSFMQRSQQPAQYLPLMVHVGLAQWGNGDTATAQELFSRVARANISEQLSETAIVCSLALALRDATNRNALFRYFTQAASDSERVALLDSMDMDTVRQWLPAYLKGKVLARQKRWSDALTVLEPLHTTHPVLEALRLKTIGHALFRSRRFADAQIAFWRSLNAVATEVAQQDVNEWIERCEWMKGRTTGWE